MENINNLNKKDVVKLKLSNGLTILYLTTKNDPISAGHLFLPGGAVDEPSTKSGLTSILWSLFLKGTRQKSAKRMAEEIESIGAYIGSGANADYSSVTFYSLSEFFEKTLTLVTEALFQPFYNNQEFIKEKTAHLASIRSKKESIFTVTYEHLNRLLYGDHPYSLPLSGSEQSVTKLKNENVINWHKKIVAPNQAVLSIASRVPFSQALKILEDNFGPNIWPAGDLSWRQHPPSPTYPSESKSVQIHQNFEQAFYMKIYPATNVGTKDYIPLKVLNALLGGGMSTRLFQSLREKNGLAYDVGSFYPTRVVDTGFYLYLGLQESKIEEADRLIKKEIENLNNEKVPDEELKQIKNYVKGTYKLDHQTNSQRAHYLGWWETLGLSSEFDIEYANEVDSVTSDQLQNLAQKMFNKPNVTLHSLAKKPVEAKIEK